MSTYDPNRGRPVERTEDNTGWIVGALVIIAIIVGIFVWAPWGSGGGDQTAANAPATSTPAVAPRETTGMGSPSVPVRPVAPAPAPSGPAGSGR